MSALGLTSFSPVFPLFIFPYSSYYSPLFSLLISPPSFFSPLCLFILLSFFTNFFIPFPLFFLESLYVYSFNSFVSTHIYLFTFSFSLLVVFCFYLIYSKRVIILQYKVLLQVLQIRMVTHTPKRQIMA